MRLFTNHKRSKRITALVLGSGGARGWAHLGVIRAMEEAGIAIDCVAGTSMGALVGAALATNCHRALESMAVNLQWTEILFYFSDLSFSRSGLIDGRKMLDFIGKHIESVNIEDLPIPYRAVATDIEAGKEVLLGEGDLLKAVRSSISIPGIFTPERRDGRWMVDGGLVNPVPVSVARTMGADMIVAVDVNQGSDVKIGNSGEEDSPSLNRNNRGDDSSRGSSMRSRLQEKMAKIDLGALKSSLPWLKKDSSAPHIFDILGNSIRIMEAQIATSMLKNDPPDILIEPDVADIGFMEFDRARKAIEAGYIAATKALKRFDPHCSTTRRKRRKQHRST